MQNKNSQYICQLSQETQDKIKEKLSKVLEPNEIEIVINSRLCDINYLL